MDLRNLKEFLKKEEQVSFKGWDFSYISNRMKEEDLPWDYRKLVKSYMSEDKRLLDMGTGGGEFLLELNPPPGKTYATESYPPNIELSKRVLTPREIEVRGINNDAYLPFLYDHIVRFT
jgi:hypothetical protein